MRLRAVISALLLAAALPAPAGNPYFCTGQGRRLIYERHYADGGRLKWRYTFSIDKVEDGSVDYSYDFRKANGAQMYGGPILMHAGVDSVGAVTLDLSATMQAVFRNLFPKADVSSEGGLTVLPADLQPGDTLEDASAVVKVLGMRYTVRVSERSVLRRETLATPAGEFDCVVVAERKVENGAGRNRDVLTHTWYAEGVGEVRHDTYDYKSSKLQTVESLISIE